VWLVYAATHIHVILAFFVLSAANSGAVFVTGLLVGGGS
jgi:hypothetical protein